MRHPERYDSSGRPRSRLLPEDSIALGLGLVTLLALLLRVVHLGDASFWVDELMTLRQGTMPGTTLWGQFLDDVQCPLPMVVATMMSRISEHEAWLRLPSALLGTLSIPLLFEVVRRVAGSRPALLAALLLAVHPMHIDHSQEVRGYAYLVFFGLAATLVLVEAGPRPSARRLLGFVLLGMGAVLSNLQGLFWMGGLALGIAVSGRVPVREWGRWAVGFLAILALASPWWWQSAQVHETGRLAPSAETGELLRGSSTWTPWALPYAGFVLGFGDTLGPSDDELHGGEGRAIPRRHLPAATAAGVLLLVVAIAGWRELDGGTRREVLAWALVPLVMALLLALRNVKPFNPRYVIAVLPVLLLFVGAGLHRLGPRVGLMALVAWLALTGISLGRYWFDPEYAREDVRAAARLIESREGSDDAVLVPGVGQVFRFYYRGDSPWSMMSHADALRGGRTVEAAVEELLPTRRFLWYVRSRPWFGDPEGTLQESLEASYRRLSRFHFDGVEVFLFDRRQEPVPEAGPPARAPSEENGPTAEGDSLGSGSN